MELSELIKKEEKGLKKAKNELYDNSSNYSYLLNEVKK
jgi:hypothetical protein